MNLKLFFSVFVGLILIGLVSATMEDTLSTLCGNMRKLVPIAALFMFFAAAIVYIVGQIMGAETRSRANVWSTAMLIGAILGLIMAASAPFLVQIFAQATLGGDSSESGVDSFRALENCK